MTYQPTDSDEAYARLGVLEFLVELAYAEAFANMTPGLPERFMEEVRERMQRPYAGPLPATAVEREQARWLKARSVEILDGLRGKIAAREADLRAGRA